MRQLFMVDLYDEHGDVEAEPVIATVHSGTLQLELDDGQVLEIQVTDLVAVLAREERAEAA